LDKASWNVATSPGDSLLSLPAQSIPSYCCTPAGDLSLTQHFLSSMIPAHQAAAAYQTCTLTLCTLHV